MLSSAKNNNTHRVRFSDVQMFRYDNANNEPFHLLFLSSGRHLQSSPLYLATECGMPYSDLTLCGL